MRFRFPNFDPMLSFLYHYMTGMILSKRLLRKLRKKICL